MSSLNKSFNFQETLSVFEKFKNIAEEPDLKGLVSEEDSNIWQRYAHGIFLDIRNFLHTGKFPHEYIEHPPFFKTAIFVLFSLSVSVFSIIFFSFNRKKILVFTGDNLSKAGPFDFRLKPLYEALNEAEVRFAEIVHTVPGKKTFINFLKRKRPVIYLEVFDFFHYSKVNRIIKKARKDLNSLELSGFNHQEKELFCSLVAKYKGAAELSRSRVQYLKYIFQTLNPKIVFMIDDVRHWSEIIEVARLKKVETIAIQHGHFTKYHIGWKRVVDDSIVFKPEQILVWSEYWKKELQNIGTYFKDQEIVVAGNPTDIKPITRIKDETLTVLIPYESDAPKNELRSLIERLESIQNIELIFKTRPDVEEVRQLEEYGIQKDGRVKITSVLDGLMPIIDVVVGTYSTFLYEAVLSVRAVGILPTSFDYGEGMVLNGLAKQLSAEKLEDELQELANLSDNVLLARREKLIGSKGMLKDTIVDIIKTTF